MVNTIGQPARKSLVKTCTRCNATWDLGGFSPCHSIFLKDGYYPICNQCIKEILTAHDFDWKVVDKLCQFGDLPFVPAEWQQNRKLNGSNAFPNYARIFQEKEHQSLDWQQYYETFKQLENAGEIQSELPGLSEARRKEMLEKWGPYDDEDYNYLERLLKGLMNTQNINGALQFDQALKICKISLQLDEKIRSGTEFDKTLAAYDKLIKAAEFTPKNTKNLNDIESVGELVKWLEKRNYKCKFFDNVSRDVVDETMKNIESYNQRLYINESGIGEEITRRIELLNAAKEQERYFDMDDSGYDLDTYENDGYDKLFEDEDFVVEEEE